MMFTGGPAFSKTTWCLCSPLLLCCSLLASTSISAEVAHRDLTVVVRSFLECKLGRQQQSYVARCVANNAELGQQNLTATLAYVARLCR
jgi:hypothetical protein